MATAEVQGALWGARPEGWAKAEEAQLPIYEEAIRRAGITAGSNVLDVGCGTGVFLRAAADRDASVSGLDAAAPLLELARRRVPGADLKVGDMESLPFDDDGFDVVTGFNSFQFAGDSTAAVTEAGRVAKPGGQVVMQVWGRPDHCDLIALPRALAPLRPQRTGAPPPTPFFQEGVLEGIASDAGLVPRESFDVVSAFEYADEHEMLDVTLSPGAVVDAVNTSGEAAVSDAIRAAYEPFRTPAGGYRLENEWHYLIAEKPPAS
jgi:SAM-dependent methyltransferase